MRNDVVIFVGPTIARHEARDVLDAIYLGPVTQGDVFQAYKKYKPKIIGIIDGCFENVPSVWHKEILFVMSEGVHVYGAASMGALRAAELHSFGMVGIGTVFETFKHGLLEDDDEVAVLHGPEKLGYPMLSEALVNIRQSVFDAFEEGVISDVEFTDIIKCAKALPYKERSYKNIQDKLLDGDDKIEISEFLSWLQEGRRDLKKEDAVLLLKTLDKLLESSILPNEVSYYFENTSVWVGSTERIERKHESEK